MTKVMDTALKSEIPRDIYPSMNIFRTEEKQSKYDSFWYHIADTRRFRNYDNLSKEDSILVF